MFALIGFVFFVFCWHGVFVSWFCCGCVFCEMGVQLLFVVGIDVFVLYEVCLKQRMFDFVGYHPLMWLFGFV